MNLRLVLNEINVIKLTNTNGVLSHDNNCALILHLLQGIFKLLACDHLQ